MRKVYILSALCIGLLSLPIVGQANEIENQKMDSRAGMKPTTIYINNIQRPFSGSSAPGTVYYQTSRYGALYRGYLTRNYSFPIIWGTGSNSTMYAGTLYRSDLPYPIPYIFNNKIDNE